MISGFLLIVLVLALAIPVTRVIYLSIRKLTSLLLNRETIWQKVKDEIKSVKLKPLTYIWSTGIFIVSIFLIYGFCYKKPDQTKITKIKRTKEVTPKKNKKPSFKDHMESYRKTKSKMVRSMPASPLLKY